MSGAVRRAHRISSTRHQQQEKVFPMNLSIHRALRIAASTIVLLCCSLTAWAAGYSAIAGRIYDASGQEIQIRGINHFGFNGAGLAPQFLWSMGWKDQIAQIKSLGFNAVR